MSIYIKKFLTIVLILSSFISLNAFADRVEAFVMPGEVIKGHAKLETNCVKCHKRFDKKAQTRLCLDCHDKIDAVMKKRSGFHGKSPIVRKNLCSACHTEHKGRDADIIKLDKRNFNHKFTNFLLKGQHKKLDCNSCHQAGKKYTEAKSTVCYGCHKKDDKHKLHLGKKCEKCHTEQKWKKTKFDHDKTKFKLTGKHKEIVCESCHANERYKGIPTKCATCHKINDVHKGKLGDKCDECHTTKSWGKMSFDHDNETEFPIRGKHKQLKCKACHKKDPKDEELAKQCYACHKVDDKHKSNFGQKCQTCHSEKGWDHSKFDHDRDTKFRLKEKHTKADCTDCHKKPLYKTKTSSKCYSCHKIDDKHKGSQGKNCQKCHNEKNWKSKIAFDHDFTKFPLVGLHALVNCKECHTQESFSATKKSCISCHRKKDVHKLRLGTFCELCHTPNGWKIWNFDHDRQTEYPLKGKHKGLNCIKCHKRPVNKKSIKLDANCSNCHSQDDPHDGKFGSSCASCHKVSSFKDIDI